LHQPFIKYFFITLFVCGSIKATAQHSFARHHYFNKIHKSRIIVRKKYNNIDDSAFVSYEFLVGNTNSWNGDIYNFYPAAQFMCSYDNNKNFEVGGFACLASSSIASLDANGLDGFLSYRFSNKFSVTVDAYTYFSNKTFLANDLGYDANLYQLYSCRFQYIFNAKKSAILGYSVLNDKQELQQSVFAEYDYNLKSYLTFVFGYATETNILKFNAANLNFGMGINNTWFKKLKYPLKSSVTIFPLMPIQNVGVSPIILLLSVDF
jgi:hypothetical protein